MIHLKEEYKAPIEDFASELFMGIHTVQHDIILQKVHVTLCRFI